MIVFADSVIGVLYWHEKKQVFVKEKSVGCFYDDEKIATHSAINLRKYFSMDCNISVKYKKIKKGSILKTKKTFR